MPQIIMMPPTKGPDGGVILNFQNGRPQVNASDPACHLFEPRSYHTIEQDNEHDIETKQ